MVIRLAMPTREETLPSLSQGAALLNLSAPPATATSPPYGDPLLH